MWEIVFNSLGAVTFLMAVGLCSIHLMVPIRVKTTIISRTIITETASERKGA